MIKGTTHHAPQPRGPQPLVTTQAPNVVKLKYHGLQPYKGKLYNAFEVVGKNRAMYYDTEIFAGILLRHNHTYEIETHKPDSVYVGAEYVKKAVQKNIAHQR